ncbi:MAG TPA: hypothetical protein VKQ71_07540 [Acidimicrobiales bacterium]|nr:hypothetical protein [Acidimicrobiales bacterium]
MSRVVIAAALIAVCAGVAFLLRRRRPEPPTQARGATPSQLDRRDFGRPEAPWLVAVFTSATCASCAGATAKAAVLASQDVAYQDISFQHDRPLHERYRIDTVPTTLVADREGVVRASFVGDPPAAELWAAVAGARQVGDGPDATFRP